MATQSSEIDLGDRYDTRKSAGRAIRDFIVRHDTAITRTLAVVIFLAVWQGVFMSGTVSPLFLSSPSLIAATLFKVFWTGEIWPHLAASGHVALIGYLISVGLGIPIGALMGRSMLARDTLEPFIMAHYSAPTVAFMPLLIIWFGIGLWSKIVLVVMGGIFVIIINTQAGVANVDRKLIETARSFRASELSILLKIVGPSALPFIITGYLIFQAGAMYDTTLIFVGVIILALTGVTLNSMLRWLESRLAPWTQTENGTN
jgi:ABC-type nitrate/sulfonate/bicarbonate transport system permease component